MNDDNSIGESEGPARKVRKFSFPDHRPACRRPGYSHIFASDNPEYHDHQREQYLRHQKNKIGHENGQGSAQEIPHEEGSAAQWTAADRFEGDDHRRSHVATQPSRPSTKMGSLTHSSLGVSNASKAVDSPQQRMLGRQTPSGAPWHQASLPGGASSGPEPSQEEDPWYYPSSDEAHQFLNDFNSHTLGLFPFVAIPTEMSSEELRRDRPLLWKAVMMQGLHLDARRQVSMGDELLSSIVLAAFVQSQKSFDLLQALEILVAWSVYLHTCRGLLNCPAANSPYLQVSHGHKELPIDKSSISYAINMCVFGFQRITRVFEATEPYCGQS